MIKDKVKKVSRSKAGTREIEVTYIDDKGNAKTKTEKIQNINYLFLAKVTSDLDKEYTLVYNDNLSLLDTKIQTDEETIRLAKEENLNKLNTIKSYYGII